MQAAAEAVKHMLRPPRAVEFPQQVAGSFVATAETAALLLERVISALAVVLYGPLVDLQQHPEGLDRDEQRSMICATDEALRGLLGVEVASDDTTAAMRLFATRPALQQHSFRFLQSVQSALDSIGAVPVKQLLAANGVDACGESITDGDAVVAFNILQYHSLLDTFGSSAPVQLALGRFCQQSGGDPIGLQLPVTVDRLRAGAYLRHLNFSLVPIVAFSAQLAARERAVERALAAAAVADADADDAEHSEQRQLLTAAAQRLSAAASFTATALAQRKEAHDAATIGDNGAAMQLLTEGLLDRLCADGSDGDSSASCASGEEAAVAAAALVPLQFKVQLLTERYLLLFIAAML